MGGLIRLVIIIALVWLVWRLIKKTLAGRGTPARRQDKPGGPEKMVRCAKCGVHVPEGQAFFHKHLSFCSQEHQQEYLEDHRE